MPLSLSRFLPLIVAVVLTLRSQAVWGTTDISEALFLGVLWVVLIAGWVIRQGQRLFAREKFKRESSVLPASILFLVVCGQTNLPLRVMFWTHKGALEQALQRPALYIQRGGESSEKPIGLLQPLQIAKSGESVRILFRRDDFVASSTLIGFAYCPQHDGCRAASFASPFIEGEYGTEPLQLSGDWIAVSVAGTDF